MRPVILIVMGVTSTGKTTIGELLAEHQRDGHEQVLDPLLGSKSLDQWEHGYE